MAKPKITVETTVSAPIDKAWKYWTSPEHITKWNFASDDWHCPHAENDARTGGKFKSTMASKDGKMSFDFEGIYDEVIDKKKISYSMEDGREVSVDFLDLNGKTKITETFDPEEVNSMELQKSGWQSILDNYKKHIESGS
jgi:uncharacterized protein YndB with AHSA1/START domain